jgi:hypothetical protein
VEKSKSLISKVDGAVIMLHGFQAKNIGLLPFANEFYLHQKTSIAEDKNIIFVFPQAPRGGVIFFICYILKKFIKILSFLGLLNVSQWWEIDLVKWLNAANGDQAVLVEFLFLINFFILCLYKISLFICSIRILLLLYNNYFYELFRQSCFGKGQRVWQSQGKI